MHRKLTRRLYEIDCFPKEYGRERNCFLCGHKQIVFLKINMPWVHEKTVKHFFADKMFKKKKIFSYSNCPFYAVLVSVMLSGTR